jgi:predicted DNA-binding transcriptional regulator AlpA
LQRLAEKAKGMPRENTNAALPPEGRRLSVKEAAYHTGLSSSTLHKLRCSGQGPRFAKIGRRVIYDVADLDSWLAKHLKRSAAWHATATRGVRTDQRLGGGQTKVLNVLSSVSTSSASASAARARSLCLPSAFAGRPVLPQGVVCGRLDVGKDFLKLLHSAGRCGHVSGLSCGLSMRRWP